MDQTAFTKQNRLLAALPADELDDLQLLHVQPPLGTVLQEAHAPIEHVYFPVDGLVSLVVRMRDGSTVETGVVGHEGAQGTWVGAGIAHDFTTATVQVAGRLLRAPASDFAAACQRSRPMRSLIDRYHAALLVQSKQLIACNALHSAEARLARWLLQVRDRIDRTRLPLTHEFLAQMLAVRRTTVTEVLGLLQERGLVRQFRGAIELVEEERLSQIACECYDVIRTEQQQLLPKAPAPA
jgi:CRP-like cAMP-binding protein